MGLGQWDRYLCYLRQKSNESKSKLSKLHSGNFCIHGNELPMKTIENCKYSWRFSNISSVEHGYVEYYRLKVERYIKYFGHVEESSAWYNIYVKVQLHCTHIWLTIILIKLLLWLACKNVYWITFCTSITSHYTRKTWLYLEDILVKSANYTDITFTFIS